MAKDPKNLKQVETTGHAWDGIEEYNNPLPRWWLWVFVACVIYAVGYCVYYPSIPYLNGFFGGTAGWSQYGELNAALEVSSQQKAPFEARIGQMSVKDIQKDPELHTYAVESGRAEYAMNCVQCHGAGGGGAKGYPNLLDDEWIYGGSLDAIVTTITHGIRSKDDPQTRDVAQMLAFGKDGALTTEQITDVVNHLKVISRHVPENDSTRRGKQVFADNCASCHGAEGQGMREMGAPPLNNDIWQYGGDTASLKETLHGGRAGVMPAWGHKLSENTIKKLALYVHALGGGEADVIVSPVSATTVSGSVISSTLVSATAAHTMAVAGVR